MEDEVFQRAAEIARRRQLAADEDRIEREAHKREIELQVECARERLDAVKKQFMRFWTQSTRSEVIWTIPQPLILEDHYGAGDPVQLPDVSVSTSIQFWRRSRSLPILVTIGTVTVTNTANPLHSRNGGTESQIFVERSDVHPVRHFTYEFEVSEERKLALAEIGEKASAEIADVEIFAANVADICLDVLALSESSGVKAIPEAEAQAEIQEAERTIQKAERSAAITAIFERVQWMIFSWAMLLLGAAFFWFVMWPPLRVWLRSIAMLGR